jgi:hypothetical protein
MRFGLGYLDTFLVNIDGNYNGERLRPGSRLLLGSNFFQSGARFPRMSVSGDELPPLLAVMAAALLMERLNLRRQLNRTPLAALGLYALSRELPVSRTRR